MTFSSELYLFALLPILVAAMLLGRNNRKVQQILILLSNIVFGLWSGFGGLLLILLMATAVYTAVTYLIRPGRRLALGLVVTVLCLPLAVMKYTAFVITNLNTWFHTDMMLPAWGLPLGISFYTFEAISLVVDVYRGYVKDVTFGEAIAYLTFFPTVTSGPILRFAMFREGFTAPADIRDLNRGFTRFVIGLSKKLLIADHLAPLADYYFDGIASGNAYSTAGLWIGSIAYSLQLYFDFSGYSDMAIGAGLMLGIRIPENFRHPYMARSIADFWKRWHKSLTLWFRDYLYIPLGGNRVSLCRHIMNLLIIWLVTGIWHGANWTFICWGLGYFVLQIFEKYGAKASKWIADRPWGHLYAMLMVNWLWVLFRSDSFTSAGAFLSGMFVQHGAVFMEYKAMRFLPFVLCVMVLIPIGAWIDRTFAWADVRDEEFGRRHVPEALKTVVLAILLIFSIAAVLNASYTPFIYGNF